MKIFTPNSTLLLLLTVFTSLSTTAQFRSYSKVYSDNIKGSSILFGNTLTHIVNSNGVADTAKMNSNRTTGNSTHGNDNANIQFVDVDGNTGAGAGTRNSSSAELAMPAGTNTIKLARLYWGARVKKADFNISLDTFKRIKLRFGGELAYTEYGAAQLDKTTTGSGNNTVHQYQAYADVTAFVQTHGAGNYTAGNVAASVGAVSGGGNYAGWCIVVVYENLQASAYNSVRVYDGFQQVYDGGVSQISTVTLTGLNVPSGPMNFRDAKMGVMVWEGDANLKLDYLKINNHNFYNAINAIDNPWNGTITDTGVHVNTKIPNYTNQMGIDIDQFYVGDNYQIYSGDSTVTLEFGTEADQYFPGLFTFVIKTKDPTVVLDKLVRDANGNNVAEVNEVLTYTLKGKNVGIANANFCVVTDTLPNTVTYVPGSLRIVAGPLAGAALTDLSGDDVAEIINDNIITFRVGTGADASTGGVLAPMESFEVEFKVTINNFGLSGNVPPIINVARITGYSDAGISSTDDGTAILEPLGGPLPITLKTFSALLYGTNLVKLDWSTLMEINCDRYEIERSFDGKTFTATGIVKGNGYSMQDQYYTTTDDITGVTAALVYYRLKQYDVDGKTSVSKVVSLKLKQHTAFGVAPNPFAGAVNISIEWAAAENTTIRIFSMNGKEMFNKTIRMNKGINNIRLDDLSRLSAGNYIIQFNTSEGKIFKQVTRL